MAAGVFGKLMGFVGLDDAYEEEEVYYEPPKPTKSSYNNDYYSAASRRSKVVNINSTVQLNLVILNPESFEDAQAIADNVKMKKPCVVNLEGVDKDIARRVVDFMSGAIYAIDGNIQKVSNGIFLVAPYNVTIDGDFKNELRSNGLFSWK